VHVVGICQVVDPADVGMRDLAGHANLALKYGETLWIGFDRLRQELQRHELAQLQVIGKVDLAHAAATELLHNAVPAAQHVTGDETAGVGC